MVAPEGFGDAFFREMGEVDVNAVVKRVMRMYRVDPRRVTITGLSMGGTGAVEIALKNPHLYAGVLALCGYYDRRTDSAVRNHPLLPWEGQLVSTYSPVDWTINGHNTPLVLMHGLHDGPNRARRLRDRFKQLGYKVDLQEFPVGHDVWTPGYAEGKAFSILGRFRKRVTPKTVVFSTSIPRFQRGYWLKIERFIDHTRWARVWAEVQDRTSLLIRTTNVRELQVTLPSEHLAHRRQVKLRIDRSDLTISPARNRGPRRGALILEGETWRLREAKDQKVLSGWKRPGMSGPIKDIYYEPIMVVYGTGNGQGKRLREVARGLSRHRRRVHIEYPVLPDTRFRPSMAKRASVILVGNELTNSVLARLGGQLPIRVKHEEVIVGTQHYFGRAVGTTYIYPNPEAPYRYLLVVGVSGESSIQIFEKLPSYLPDFVVFDEQMATQKKTRVAGADRQYLDGGYFTEGWTIPQKVEPAPQP